MKNSDAIVLRRKRGNSNVLVKIKTPTGVQWVSTGHNSMVRAREACEAGSIGALIQAASINALTADIIARLTVGKNTTCAELLSEWQAAHEERMAPLSLDNYRINIASCLKLGSYTDQPISSVTRQHLHTWVNHGGSHSTRKQRLQSIRSFFGYAQKTGKIVGNIAELVYVDVRGMLVTEREAKERIPFTPEEYNLLMASPKVHGFWRIAIACGYWGGIRLRDIACLQWASIKEDRLVFYQQKTGQRVELMLDDPAMGDLKKTLGEIDKNETDYCYPNQEGWANRTTMRAHLSVTFQRLLRRHGIHGKTFHGLRHACAMRLLQMGLTKINIAKVLGHADPESTAVYLAHERPRVEETEECVG